MCRGIPFEFMDLVFVDYFMEIQTFSRVLLIHSTQYYQSLSLNVFLSIVVPQYTGMP